MRIVSVEALSEEILELRVRMSRGEWETLGRPSINDKLPILGGCVTEEEFVKLLCNYEGATLERIYDLLQRAGIIMVWKSKEQGKEVSVKKRKETPKTRVKVRGQIIYKYADEEFEQDLEPYSWDFDYFKAWLTDCLNPKNKTVKICLELEPVRESSEDDRYNV